MRISIPYYVCTYTALNDAIEVYGFVDYRNFQMHSIYCRFKSQALSGFIFIYIVEWHTDERGFFYSCSRLFSCAFSVAFKI